MLKIRISKQELKNLYLGRDGAKQDEITVCSGDEDISNGDLTLLRAMLEVFKDKSGNMVVPEFSYVLRKLI